MPTALLIIASFTDLKYKKINNYFLLIFSVLILVAHTFWGPKGLFLEGLSGFLFAFVLMLPLYLLKILGGGDLKLFSVFGLSTNIEIVFFVFVTSLLWGGLLGVLRSILSKEAHVFFSNFLKIITFKKPDKTTLQKIPYSVAIFCGWVTYIVYTQHGRFF